MILLAFAQESASFDFATAFPHLWLAVGFGFLGGFTTVVFLFVTNNYPWTSDHGWRVHTVYIVAFSFLGIMSAVLTYLYSEMTAGPVGVAFTAIVAGLIGVLAIGRILDFNEFGKTFKGLMEDEAEKIAQELAESEEANQTQSEDS